MQTVWLYLCSIATLVTSHLLGQAIWGHIWKSTREKMVQMQLLWFFKQAIWGHIIKPTLKKNPSNATYATMHLLQQIIWETFENPLWKKSSQDCKVYGSQKRQWLINKWTKNGQKKGKNIKKWEICTGVHLQVLTLPKIIVRYESSQIGNVTIK